MLHSTLQNKLLFWTPNWVHFLLSKLNLINNFKFLFIILFLKKSISSLEFNQTLRNHKSKNLYVWNFRNRSGKMENSCWWSRLPDHCHNWGRNFSRKWDSHFSVRRWLLENWIAELHARGNGDSWEIQRLSMGGLALVIPNLQASFSSTKWCTSSVSVTWGASRCKISVDYSKRRWPPSQSMQ